VDGRVRKPIPGKIPREEKQDYISPLRLDKAEQQQPPKPKTK
jgi:hypothetical protein